MSGPDVSHLPRWSVLVPPAAIVVLAVSWGRDLGVALLPFVVAGVVTAVIAAVHHAETVALRVGEPFGTLILAVAVTIIEVALIVTLMLAEPPGEPSTLARDTAFAAIMITCHGVVGLSLLAAQWRHQVLRFQVQGTLGALGTLATLVTLSLVLPTFTTSSPGATFSGPQLAFAGVASLTLYGVYVFVETVRHRDYFLPVGEIAAEEHAQAPTNRVSLTAVGLLVVCLVAVVGLAKAVSPTIEEGLGEMARRCRWWEWRSPCSS